ncbi:MAG: NADH-quinone oxidoreductase subunit M [Pseudomonadota bacterium]
MADTNLLTLITFFPLIAALALIVFLRGDDEASNLNAKRLALLTTSATFLLSLAVLTGFDPENPDFQFVEEGVWIGGLTYKLGVDGLSLPFVMLTTFFMPLVIYASWGVTTRVKEYMAAFLILEALILGVFVSLDLILFYLFFEAGLIPMFLIIGIWGGVRRIYAAFKFFLYTLLGSLLMLVAMIYMFYDAGTTDIAALLNHSFSTAPLDVLGYTVPGGVQTLLWLAFFASFAVKMPMWPVHTWLPDAHVQAPTAGSVVLAAILLKMGGYGFLRFSLPMFPVASELLTGFVFFLSVVAIVYTSLVALMQEDIKKLIAYSSVAHMGFVTLGIFAANQQGIDGAMFQMISHGFISGALFLLVGVIYDRTHTREIAAFGGLAERMPIYAAVMLLFTMGNVGLPGTSGFVGEFLTMMGAFQVSKLATIGAATGVILSAAYALWLYRRVVFGALIRRQTLATIADMDTRERLVIAPLVVATLLLGVYPSLVTDLFAPSVEALVENVEDARLAAAEASQAAEAAASLGVILPERP